MRLLRTLLLRQCRGRRYIATGRVLNVLGIETSCDDTCCAIVSSDARIIANTIHSEPKLHEEWGGIVPTVAMSSHQRHLPEVIQATLQSANMKIDEVDAIAVTRGPGLLSSLSVGMNSAKGIAAAVGKPLIGVHHMQAHAFTPLLLQEKLDFPHLTLLVSGGHTILLLTKSLFEFEILANSSDDSMGDCIDKVARMLGLGWDGGSPGAALEKFLLQTAHLPVPMIPFPVPLQEQYRRKGPPGFSFSGLKSAVKRYLSRRELPAKLPSKKVGTPSSPPPYNVSSQTRVATARGFMHAAITHVTQQINLCISNLEKRPNDLVLSGGVASNLQLRRSIQLAIGGDMRLIAPEPTLCRDNAAMIAWIGCLRLQYGDVDELSIEARQKWSLKDLHPPIRYSSLIKSVDPAK